MKKTKICRIVHCLQGFSPKEKVTKSLLGRKRKRMLLYIGNLKNLVLFKGNVIVTDCGRPRYLQCYSKKLWKIVVVSTFFPINSVTLLDFSGKSYGTSEAMMNFQSSGTFIDAWAENLPGIPNSLNTGS